MAAKKIDPSQNTLPNQPLIACFSFVLITCQKRLFHPSFSFRNGIACCFHEAISPYDCTLDSKI